MTDMTRPAVYDCFTFKDELDLLEMRLEIMADAVDHLVLVEATETFAGRPKALTFRDHRDRFAAHADKIIHVVVDDLPQVQSRWLRERAQRNAIHRGLVGARPDDLLLISDIDEIVDPIAIEQLRRDLAEPTILQMQLMYYKVNLRGGTWDLARAIRARDAGCLDCLRRTTDLPRVTDAGWHLSYLIDPRAAVEKIHDFSHAELEAFATESHLERCMRLQLDGSRGNRLELVPDDELDPPLRRLRATRPDLFAEPLGPRARLEQLAYGTTVRSRWHVDPELAERHPYQAAARALPARVRAAVRRA
jgi:beta-1,4-mannosyl-glycoprotein beta-1,4-N-acetylglucosaminyltransferase